MLTTRRPSAACGNGGGPALAVESRPHRPSIAHSSGCLEKRHHSQQHRHETFSRQRRSVKNRDCCAIKRWSIENRKRKRSKRRPVSCIAILQCVIRVIAAKCCVLFVPFLPLVFASLLVHPQARLPMRGFVGSNDAWKRSGTG